MTRAGAGQHDFRPHAPTQTHQGGITIMTGLHRVVSTPATASRAAAEAAAADHALSQLGRARERPGPTLVLAEVLAAGFEVITHGLLAAAAAVEDSGADTADAVTDLGERLAVVDGTLGSVADAIDDTRPRLRWCLWRRWRQDTTDGES